MADYSPFEGFDDDDINARERYGSAQGGRGRRSVSRVLVVFVVIAAFLSGMAVHELILPQPVRLAKWYYNIIKDNSYYASQLSEEEIAEIIYRMGAVGLSGLGDGYVDFLTPADSEAFRRAYTGTQYSGMIGVTFAYLHTMLKSSDETDEQARERFGTHIVIYDVYAGSPAAKAGIKRFDKLCGLKHGDTEKDWTTPQTTVVDISADMAEVPAADEFTLILEEPVLSDGEYAYLGLSQREVALSRGTFDISFAEYHASASVPNLPSDTAIVRHTSFDLPQAGDFVAAMERFKSEGKRNLILDMRFNGGGYVSAAQVVASYLVQGEKSGSVLLGYDKYADGHKENIYSAPSKYSSMNFGKIVVLVNGMSASATELVLMAMQYYGTVDAIIGTNTYGKGIKQNTFFQNEARMSGYGIKITVSQLFNPDGESLHGIGIAPDFEVPYAITPSLSADTGIEKAIEFLASAEG